MDKLVKEYRFGFEVWGLVLFIGIMLPNFVWFAVPAPNDILRGESVTEIADIIGSVFQAVMIAALCLLKRTDCPKLRFSPFIVGAIACCIAYWSGWVLYYNGIADAVVVLMLTVPPCGAFLLFTLDRKNYIASVPVCGFTVCHLIYALANFIF